LLRVDGTRFVRLGHLKPLPLPGGDRAARQPWRMAAAVLHETGRNAEIATRFASIAGAPGVAGLLACGLQCPRSSSMGRLFDAAAGLLGLCSHMQYEAQAAMLLEQAATRFVRSHGMPQPMAGGWAVRAHGQLDLLPLLASLEPAADPDAASARFHATLVAALCDWVLRAVDSSGLRTLAWGGGCFLNGLLSTGLRQQLERQHVTVLSPARLSPGDASIAVGQAWVALQGATDSEHN